MSWIETTTLPFTVPIDFHSVIQYGISEEETVRRALQDKIVGKNYMGYLITEIVEVTEIGTPYIHPANELIVTPPVSFTAKCLRLMPDRIIPGVIMQPKNLGRHDIPELPRSEINIIYTDKGADFPVNTLWPTVVSSVSHPPHSTKIIVTGSILAPSSPIFFKHDGSKAASERFIIQRREPSSSRVAEVFGKLRRLYEIEGIVGAVVNGFDGNDDEDTIYTTGGPIGPLYKLKVGSSIGELSWEDIKMSATHKNVYDVEGGFADATNAVIFVAEDYVADESEKKRTAPYLSYVRNEMMQIKKLLSAKK